MSDHPLPPTAMDFRFLDLPADIRLMVYEYIPTCLMHDEITIETYSKSGTLWIKGTKVTFVTIWYPTIIRLICKLIREEATTVVARTTAKCSRTSTVDELPNKTRSSRLSPKIIVPFGGLEVIAHEGGPLDAALESLSWALEARKTGSSCVTARPENPHSSPDSLILANWARQAGWRLAQMSPQTRTIDIAIDQYQLQMKGAKKWKQPNKYDTASILRFEKNVEKLWLARQSRRGNMRIRIAMTPRARTHIYMERDTSFDEGTPPVDDGLVIEDFGLRRKDWDKMWVPEDWLADYDQTCGRSLWLDSGSEYESSGGEDEDDKTYMMPRRL